MGAKHSIRRDLSFDSGAGAAWESSHRSSASSGKLRSRWTKIPRSHSDRTPSTLSANRINYGETSATKYLQDDSLTKVSKASTACQTQVQCISVMTQTEYDELLGWKMIDDDDQYLVVTDSPSNQHDAGNGSNFDPGHKSHCIPFTEIKMEAVGQGSFKHVSLNEANSCLSNKETYSSVVCNGNHMKNNNCAADLRVRPHSCTAKYLSSETGAVCSAVENFKPENKMVQLPSRGANTQRQTAKNTNADADTKLPYKRKQSNSSEGRSVRDCEQRYSMDHVIHRENAVDLGSSICSLNSEDMMLDTDVDDVVWPSNVRSHHPSVGSSTYCCWANVCLSSKSSAVPECSDDFGHQIKHSGNGIISPRSDSVGRKYSEHMQNDGIDSPNHSGLAVTGAVNGWKGRDPVVELSPTAISSRCVCVCATFIINC